jgi:hypothetical protein
MHNTDEELLLAHNVYSNKGAYAIFIGSGISRNAGIPTGWEVILKLINRLAVLKTGTNQENLESWYHDTYKRHPEYSYIIGELTNTSEERLNLLKPFFEATEDEISDGLKKPTPAHKSIAKLIQKAYVRVVITTNFDRLLENALREIGIEATVISNPAHIENVMPLIHSPITIVKVNGDYLDTSFLNLESELSTYDERMENLLKFIFENFGLITSGWSAKWDTAIRRILESSNKFRFSNFFTYVHRYEQELQDLALKRCGKLLQIDNADSFFTELAENIEALEKGEKANPLTRQVALERMRKYIARDEMKIPFYELFKQIQDKSFDTIFGAIETGVPNEKTVKEVINFRTNQLELLSFLVADSVYWCKPLHHEILLNILLKFAHPPQNATSYTIWSNLNYLPALLLQYTIGISALYRRNYQLLRQLFSLKISNPYREGENASILSHVNTSEVIDKEQLNAVQGTNLIVPVSELLYKFTQPFFLDYLPSERQFDELFDEFELILSLKFIEMEGEAWFPRGRYAYRRRDSNNIVYTAFENLQKHQELHEWVLGQLFDYSKLQSSFAFFNESVKQWSWH